MLFIQAYAFLLIILSSLFINILSATEQTEQPIRKAAIFVENRVGQAFDNKVPVLEDFITSRITEKGFSIISREVVINSLKNYNSEKTKSPDSEKLDTLLSNNTSALRLAQLMGVDYIIVTSITSFQYQMK